VRFSAVGVGVQLELIPIELHHEGRTDTGRIACAVRARLDRRDGVPVHDLQRGRKQTVGDDRRDRFSRLGR